MKTGTLGVFLGMALTVGGLGSMGQVFAAEGTVMDEQQIQGLIETAAKATDRPDHDFAANSIRSLLEHAKDLHLSDEQREKLTSIKDHYSQTKSTREAAYQQSEKDALKLIHDRHSSLTVVEEAVKKADTEHSKLRMAGVTALRQAGDVLRPEQYTQWRQIHSAGRQMAHSQQGNGSGEPVESERQAPH
jgi:hypothetical protein